MFDGEVSLLCATMVCSVRWTVVGECDRRVGGGGSLKIFSFV